MNLKVNERVNHWLSSWQMTLQIHEAAIKSISYVISINSTSLPQIDHTVRYSA